MKAKDKYYVQYLIEPTPPVAVSDWKEHIVEMAIEPSRLDIKQAMIEKLINKVTGPIIILDY